jgi:hypothetical protein
MKQLLILSLFSLLSCQESNNEIYHNRKLVSKKGETIYVRSVNWGLTGDSQLSIITKDSLADLSSENNRDIVKGLDPFLYSFHKDTLTLYFYNTVTYRIKEKFSTIKVSYKKIQGAEYNLLRKSDKFGKVIFSVPFYEDTKTPQGFPKPGNTSD